VLQLPRGQREVLTLRIDGDLPFAEIAEILGISENNAKVHFHHAVKRLKLLMAAKVREESR
jgi:RNA polymerase sigma-70 factor (ECF subfamily)